MHNSKLSRAYWKQWIIKHEKLVSFAVFVGGFTLDNLTLRRIDRLLDILILFGWLFVGSIGIILLNIAHHRPMHLKIFKKESVFLPLLIPFALGALFSGFTIFYMRSAVFATSWPFLLIILALFLGNEFFKERYLHLNFQVVILFTTVFFLMILFVPIVLGKIGDSIFLLSGAISLVAIGAFVHFLYFFLPKEARGNRKKLAVWIGGVFLVINFFYFTNLIPPVPLALVDGGVYHYVTHAGPGKYELLSEEPHWYDYFTFYDDIHVTEGEPVYAWSAIFAPTGLTTKIYHRWHYYDPGQGKWTDSGVISFNIFGGTDYGYRGYSEKTYLTPGKWRVDVSTERGQVLGRIRFNVLRVESSVPLVTIVK